MRSGPTEGGTSLQAVGFDPDFQALRPINAVGAGREELEAQFRTVFPSALRAQVRVDWEVENSATATQPAGPGETVYRARRLIVPWRTRLACRAEQCDYLAPIWVNAAAIAFGLYRIVS
jgi:hypothetical protein